MLNVLRAVIHLSCVIPLAWVVYILTIEDESALGADPIKELEHFLGYGAIIIFCMMFLLGIVLQILRKNQYQILRRPLGLWAFFWALLHVSSYLVLELGFDLALFLSELVHRPYLIVGAFVFSILFIMAITSLPAVKRALGQKWSSIHKLAYPAIMLAAIHYYWSVKSVTLGPIVVGVIVVFIVVWKFIGNKLIIPVKA